MQSLIFSIITSVLSVTWSFGNHSNMQICCSKNISYWLSWKQLCCLLHILVESVILFSGLFDNIDNMSVKALKKKKKKKKILQTPNLW